MRVRLSRRRVRRWGRGGAIAVALLGATLGFYHLGRAVTPPAAGQPVIYSPAVRRTEDYRRQAQAWLAALSALDAELVTLLHAESRDIYALAEDAQRALDAAVALDQAVLLTYPPASMASLHAGLQSAADGYLDAAIALNHWVGEPTATLYVGTLEALRTARAAQAVVAANPWLSEATPAPAPIAFLEE